METIHIGMIFQQMIDSMAYINTKNYSKTGKSMDKEIIPKYIPVDLGTIHFKCYFH